MKKLLTLSVMFILCLLTFATDFMRIKLKDGNIARYEVDNIEEVDFEIGKDTSIIGDTTAVDTSASPLRFRITSGSTVEVSGYRYYYNNTDSIAIPEKVRINGKIYNVTSIGDGVFGGYSGLTSIRIPESVTSIGAEAFIGCSDLTRINIPEGVTRIDSATFARCSSLREITLPKNVTSIGNSAFSGCNGLTSIQIPSSVTDIDKFAFYRCINLDVTIDNSEGNVKVGEFAFEACKSVTYLKNEELTAIDTSDTPLKFRITSDSTAEVIPNTNGYYWWLNSPTYPDLDSIVIPSKIRIEHKIYSVSSISDWAFCGCSSLTNISIPNSVTSIGHSAFSGCSGLTSINIPNSITSIADTTFAGCSKLTSINIPNSVTSIGSSAFSGCSKLTSIDIPNSVTSIGSYTFYDCSGLTSISIPESVTSIGSSAFSGCTNLDVTIDNSEGNVKVGEFAFEACKSVTYLIIDTSDTPLKFRITSDSTAEVTRDYSYEDLDSIFIPAKVRIDGKVYDVTYIDEYAFVYCSNLTSINVSSNKSNYSSIDGVLFNKNKTEIVNVPRGRKGTYSIPSSVTSINSWAFNGCSGLTSINIPNSVTSIGDGAFKGCYDLTSINIPNSVTSIGDGAFYNCYDLTSVSIPDSVSSIGSGAFEGCNKLEPKLLVYDNGTKCYGWVGNRDSCINVVIPSGVKSIGNRAFYGCSGLTSVYIPNSIHSFGDYAFYDCTNLDIVIDAYNHNIGIQGHNAFKNCKSVTFRSDYVR